MILFWNPSGVDDRSVKKSVDRLSSRGGKVAMFTDTRQEPRRATRASPAAASVTQTPRWWSSTAAGQAEVLTGYYDYQTINQFVSNASRRK